MKWTNVSDGLPRPKYHITATCVASDEVLCQNSRGDTFLGWVNYMTLEALRPEWAKEGSDTYELGEVVRWILLSDILSEIS